MYVFFITTFQLHYLSPAKHLYKSQVKMLENLINALETENRSRIKRNQHPLTYQEAYSLLTQLIEGDVLHACQSAKINWNSYNIEEDHRRIWGHILGGAHINSGPYEEKWPRLQ